MSKSEEDERINVSTFRKDLKGYLGKTGYGQKEFDIKNHGQDVAWVTSPEKKKMLKPFERLYEFVEDEDAFRKDLENSLSGDVADARKVLATMKKHFSSKKASSVRSRQQQRATN